MLNLVIFGPPGSGKGTQAAYLATKYNLVHLSTGEILRQEIISGSALGAKVKDFMSRGELVPDQLMSQVVAEGAAENLSLGGGLIFDGYPRNDEQAIVLDKIMSDLQTKIDLAINLTASDEELVKRVLLRAATSKRVDDTEDVIRHRLEVYQEHAENLISFYRQQDKLVEVPGEGEPLEVLQRIVSAIDNYKKDAS